MFSLNEWLLRDTETRGRRRKVGAEVCASLSEQQAVVFRYLRHFIATKHLSLLLLFPLHHSPFPNRFPPLLAL